MKKILSYLLVFIVAFVLGYIAVPKLLGGRTMNPIWNRTDLDVEVSIDDFSDATTTPIAVQNPFGATSTVDFFIYDQTGVATSTYTLNCGTSTTAFGTPSDWVISAIEIATSTKDYLVNNSNAGTNSKERIIVDPNEWIVCDVTTHYPGAFTEVTNTYDGNYKIRWFR